MKLARRMMVLVVLIAAGLVAPVGPAHAAVIDLHKSTRDVGGVHVAVVLRKNTVEGTIFAYCSISGNSSVVKHLQACRLKAGSPEHPVSVGTPGHQDGPRTGFVESGTPGFYYRTTIPYCIEYAAYIGYAFNGGSTTTGRTLFVNPC